MAEKSALVNKSTGYESIHRQNCIDYMVPIFNVEPHQENNQLTLQSPCYI